MRLSCRFLPWTILVLLGLGLSALFNPRVSELVLAHLIARARHVTVREVSIARQTFKWPGRLEVEQLSLRLDVGGRSLALDAPRVTVSGLQTLLARRNMTVSGADIAVHYDAGELRGLSADIHAGHSGISGPFKAAEVRWGKWQAADLTGAWRMDAAGHAFTDLSCALYGGRLQGDLLFYPVHERPGAYTAEFAADGVDLTQVARVEPVIGEQLSGVVAGTVKLQGDTRDLRLLDAAGSMPGGGLLSASLLAALTQHLPASRQKQQIDLLVRHGDKLAIEVFSFTIKGGESGKFGGEVRLKSRAVNLELNITHQINTDGRARTWLEYWQQLMP